MNGATGKSDIEGQTVRETATEMGRRRRFNYQLIRFRSYQIRTELNSRKLLENIFLTCSHSISLPDSGACRGAMGARFIHGWQAFPAQHT